MKKYKLNYYFLSVLFSSIDYSSKKEGRDKNEEKGGSISFNRYQFGTITC